MKHIVIPPTGEYEERDEDITNELLRGYIGQDMESLAVPDGWSATVLAAETRTSPGGERLMLNNKATILLGDTLWPGSTIVGTVVILGPADEEGEFTGLSEVMLDTISLAIAHRSPA